MLTEQKVVEINNKLVGILNEYELTDYELVLILSQLLIYSGHSITKKNIDLDSVSWDDLYQAYYTDNNDNDIGLGLILNGASMTSALPEDVLNQIKGDVTANQGVKNDQVSSTTKVSQESSSASVGPN